MTPDAVPQQDLIVPVRVQTRSSSSGIHGVQNGQLRVRTKAPPADGKANRDVSRQLARAFGVPRSRVSLKSGARDRNKLFVIANPSVLPPWLAALRRRP